LEKEKMTRYTANWLQLKSTWIVSTLLIGVVALAVALPSQAQSRKSKSSRTQLTSEVDAPATGHRVVSLTFKQMGAWSAVKLRGVEGTRVLAFPIRTDEVVVAAKLRIAYDYSPALIPELSHLKIMLNERVAMVEALPIGKGLANAREITLDPRLFRDMNELRFTLIGHYTRQCEDPYHSSLWLSLSDVGRLELTLAPLSSVNDLKYLPTPFFEKRDNLPLTLPFVFASPPSLGTLKSAGVLASWFGQQAGAKGAQFPVSLNSLPDGNAVVFLMGGETLQGVKGVAASTLSVQPHPNNPSAKLLLVSGVNEVEIARAVRAISMVTPTLTGQTMTVTKEVNPAPRKPYDAPAWIHTDRAVKFGEIAKPEELRVQGYYPEVIRLNYRAPPDLFTWRTHGAPVRLKYRASRLPMHRSSSLNVNINSVVIDTLPLNEMFDKTEFQNRPILPKTENKSISEASLFIPPYAVTGRDQLQLGFSFDITREGECRHMPPDNLQAAIDSESTIDFSSFPHYIALPNLSYFSNLGFPFTRMADLSETAVVVPDRPNVDEMGMYLVLMGRMGEATGYPVLKHEVITASDVEKMADRDLLVIGSAENQKLMSLWANRMPMVQVNGERRVREPNVSWRPTYRWEQADIDPVPAEIPSLNLSGVGTLTTMMAFESPLKATRSVVFFYADKSADLRKISDLLTDAERTSMIQGDFVVVDDKNVSHVKVGETYYLGSLPWLSKFRWFFSDQPLVLALIILLVTLLLATILYRPMRKLVEKRTNNTKKII
jgi:cellulose synthase operon protein B